MKDNPLYAPSSSRKNLKEEPNKNQFFQAKNF